MVEALNQMARQTAAPEGASGGQDAKAKEASSPAASRPTRDQLTAFHLHRFSPHALLDPALLFAYRAGEAGWVDGVLVSTIRKALKVRPSVI